MEYKFKDVTYGALRVGDTIMVEYGIEGNWVKGEILELSEHNDRFYRMVLKTERGQDLEMFGLFRDKIQKRFQE